MTGGKNMDSDRRAAGAIERHIQTILISVIVGALTYAASYVFNDKADKAVLASKLDALTTQVAEMRGEVGAMRSNLAGKEQVLDHETRIRALELRVMGAPRP